MARYFAVPILATVVALVGIRLVGSPSPRAEKPLDVVVSLTPEVPEAPAIVAPPAVEQAPPPAPVAPTPAPAPTVIFLEPLPQPAPIVKTEVIERTVYVPQQPTVIYAPTTIYAPVVEVAPPPPQDVGEIPVIVVVNPPHGRPAPAPRHPKARQDSFFKEIPFLPPTPKGPRWSP